MKWRLSVLQRENNVTSRVTEDEEEKNERKKKCWKKLLRVCRCIVPLHLSQKDYRPSESEIVVGRRVPMLTVQNLRNLEKNKC